MKESASAAVVELKPLLELAKDKDALKGALVSFKEARKKAIKESIKSALKDSGGRAELGDIQNLLNCMCDDPSVALDLIAEAYKEKMEADQYAELLKMIAIYKKDIKPMSYKNSAGLPDMTVADGWLGWWPMLSQNSWYVCHKPAASAAGNAAKGDPDDCCVGAGGEAGGEPMSVGCVTGCVTGCVFAKCCPKKENAPVIKKEVAASAEQPPLQPKYIYGCTCMGRHCTCLRCVECATMIPFRWSKEAIYTIVEADNLPVICKIPKETVPEALKMGDAITSGN